MDWRNNVASGVWYCYGLQRIARALELTEFYLWIFFAAIFKMERKSSRLDGLFILQNISKLTAHSYLALGGSDSIIIFNSEELTDGSCSKVKHVCSRDPC